MKQVRHQTCTTNRTSGLTRCARRSIIVPLRKRKRPLQRDQHEEEQTAKLHIPKNPARDCANEDRWLEIKDNQKGGQASKKFEKSRLTEEKSFEEMTDRDDLRPRGWVHRDLRTTRTIQRRLLTNVCSANPSNATQTTNLAIRLDETGPRRLIHRRASCK